ncbi:MAG: FAD-binding oxidoreductase [Lentisphaerae bacterium]|nr:FAD-binding oxidoreductase [Lentisphaerota bacterium]
MSPTAHILTPREVPDAAVPRLIEGAALADYAGYLTDESRRSGRAAALAFPTTLSEVSGAVRLALARGWDITVSNARTGIAAGAVPEGGLLLSLERLSRVTGLRLDAAGNLVLRCQAGVALSEVQKSLRRRSFQDSAAWSAASGEALEALRQKTFFYPPDPTETGAAIGGTIACNASGAHTFLYGPTRPYVEALTVVLGDGRVLDLERGACRATPEGRFGVRQPDGAVCWGTVPHYAWPRTKNAAGYYAAPEMDLIDLFIGSEGTLGIIVEAEIRALPAPEARCAVMTFWPDEAAALRFTRAVRGRRHDLGLEAVEYVDPNAMALLRRRRAALGAVSGVPECLPAGAGSAIYLDVGTTSARLEAVLEALCTAVAAHGGDPEVCWSAVAEDERERLRVFRHALPETVNAMIAEVRRQHPGVTKLGTDMAVPDEALEAVLALYRSRLDEARLPYVIFGHVGDNHLHVNILPQTPDDYDRGRRLYREFARAVVAMGGSPAAEHGIGRLKTDFLEVLYGADGVAQMRAVKAVLDPGGRLGAGILFQGARPS